jgi:hypothetical protein
LVVTFFKVDWLLARPLVDAFEVAVQHFDASIEQRTYREETFSLAIHKVLSGAAREKPKELIGDRVPPISDLIGELGFLFSSFFGHILSLPFYCSKIRPLSRGREEIDDFPIRLLKAFCRPFARGGRGMGSVAGWEAGKPTSPARS